MKKKIAAYFVGFICCVLVPIGVACSNSKSPSAKEQLRHAGEVAAGRVMYFKDNKNGTINPPICFWLIEFEQKEFAAGVIDCNRIQGALYNP